MGCLLDFSVKNPEQSLYIVSNQLTDIKTRFSKAELNLYKSKFYPVEITVITFISQYIHCFISLFFSQVGS